MRYIEDEGRIVWSASDLKAAAECEFAWLRAIDAKLRRVSAVEEPEDLTLERAAMLGTEHEVRVLREYERAYPGQVEIIPETRSSDAEALAAAVQRTREALKGDAQVIYQAAFAADDFVGFADFIVRDHDGAWLVQDTKLARRARVTALMQLAAYVDQLDQLGIRRADRVELILGDGSTSAHAVRDILPVYLLRRARLRALIADREPGLGAHGAPIAWGDERGALRVVACGRCATCDLEVVAHRDLLLVAGMRPVQRERLRAAGLTTIDHLVGASSPPPKMSAEVFESLRTQARLQIESPAGGITDAVALPGDVPIPTYRVVLPSAIAALPRPDLGDIFFDFEGDPLYTEGTGSPWGIDYLFGWVDTREQYTALWAHTFAQEREALEKFLAFLEVHRRTHPNMHIYHYAPYETTHLLEMAARHGVGEAEVDRLLRDGVFVDLYPVVRRALRVGSRSYSIKKLEPLYMGADVRTSDVQRGDDSIVKYAQARVLADAGDAAGADRIFADLADYNRYDCVSTLRLRDWLAARAAEAGMRPSRDPEPEETGYEASVRAERLRVFAEEATNEDEARALRLGAAAIDYYPREAKTFWASHFTRLREPLAIWQDTRDVILLDRAQSRVLTDWQEGPRSHRRVLELRGDVAPGTRLGEGAQPFAVYAAPAPFAVGAHPRFIHSARTVRVLEDIEDGVIVEETSSAGAWSELPVAIAPAAPPRAGSQQAAIDEWADSVIDAFPTLPADPATDLLVRRPPRTGRGTLGHSGDDIGDIAAAVADLQDSYLAVQGPPGTGKTYVGSHVVARLVREKGFAVGVVAQSHAVVENMLDRIVAAGVPAAQVAKAPKTTTGNEPFTVIAKDGLAEFTRAHPEGYVIGGTAWDLTHPRRVGRKSLDLLVIDEAGQFSLASTVAVAAAAHRVLLLGDPQQLPQVSQGTHPEPVDTSALGWVMQDASVIDPEAGYFLAQSRRMRPEVAEAVSDLSYDGKLVAHPDTAGRHIDGVPAGIVPIALTHTGNSTSSLEEADVVLDIVRDLLGRTWSPGDGTTRPLTEADIIVVTPYNAQQVTVEEALEAGGYGGIRVGTVDKFQGQEAAIAILSLAASSGRDAPRGLEFLLLQNRINVAISRAQHTAYIVYSTGLLDDLPRTPDGVARLSGFARLVQTAAHAPVGVDSAPDQEVPWLTR